ncbi:mycofactocin-coupled SDR family oxidoreductase [Nocardia sp. 348MFTsu5.1]|uniref:mycofactocin-coupled SDR family oxidoreductase n=1 Tax=Nocardia sp. 348MFTsu5.1 TaxID=1172185 RepID=UPI00039BF5CB|nr:mycofactocin-coupled SDR family oxidoreductase [Nocardia sp. 348MFTsu5.1]
MGRVDGKVALITGAARGLGRAFALRLAEEGADIIAVDLCANVDSALYGMSTSVELEQTAADVRTLGRRVVTARADVRDLEALAEGVRRGVEELGGLDLVCANAGLVSYGGVLDLTSEQWADVMDVHVTGSWNTVRAAAPFLTQSDAGSIVLTSSTAGLRAEAYIAHYVAAKHGQVGLMKSLAIELAPSGIRCNSVHPTSTNTHMITNEVTRRLMSENAGGDENLDHAARAKNLLGVPWVEAVDVANAVLFLHSDEARYITGVSLAVDAGAGLI